MQGNGFWESKCPYSATVAVAANGSLEDWKLSLVRGMNKDDSEVENISIYFDRSGSYSNSPTCMVELLESNYKVGLRVD